MIVTWQDALDYLYGLANWETRPPGTDLTFELDRVRAVLADLENPHLAWPAIHVAGTNGKGSTCALVAAGLRAAGFRVGLFTSPHLHTVRERVQVDQNLVTERYVVDWLNDNRPVFDRHEGLTTFEALTALAFDTFSKSSVDVAVVEVGLGGRLDTTNVVVPAVCAITPIGLDHMSVLGNTLPEIAADKAGIIKCGVPVVCAPQDPQAHRVIEDVARCRGSRLVRVGHEVRIESVARTENGQDVSVRISTGQLEETCDVSLPLVGAHQGINVATAIGVLDALGTSGWDLPLAVSAKGMTRVAWPARFEQLSRRPVVIVDGAHNEPAVASLRAELGARRLGSELLLVVGVSRDKDVPGLLAELLPGVRRVYATKSEHPRSMPAEELAAACRALGKPASSHESPHTALACALRDSSPESVVVATGSIFLAADVREAWASMGNMPMPPRDPPPR